MPRQQARKQLLNFVGGLNTESSPLLFPENTAKAIDNVDLRRDGSVKRRRGINYESLGVFSSASFTDAELDGKAITVHEWKSVQGDDSLNFSLLQVGGTLYFHTLGATVLSGAYLGSISLSAIQVRTDYEDYPISSAVGKGKLFIVSRGISPAYIQYDTDTETFTGVKLTLKVRDIDGIEEDRDSPVVFGSEVTPTEGVDPVNDVNDVLNPIIDIEFDGFGIGTL